VQAARLYAAIGSLPDESFALLCSARAAQDGQHELERAIAMFRALRADAYLRYGEALVDR
jgi:hypothetical protein